ncbi:MAG: hypothetical protein KAU62_08595 [Candidatus Heimdallarchaeota archaeon]|nr:hypothetical protein [Candidatus Heimdallarchaeota archaeon]MCK4611197.1 hypothetical protein [Candidatus Heimdallarchaeota archaeon]
MFSQIVGSNVSDEVDPNNHNYPVYNLINLALNNQTSTNLSAQIMIFNQTTQEWELNQQLIEVIEQDMQTLATTIEKLSEIYLYSLNTSFSPGSLNFLLVTKINLAQNAVTTILSAISSDTEKWWYVKHASYPIIDLSEIAVEGSFKYNVIDAMDIQTGYYIYFENGSESFVCREQNGLSASLWLFNGTDWVPNVAFRQLLETDLLGLKQRITEIKDLEARYLHPTFNRDPEKIYYKNIFTFAVGINYTKCLGTEKQLKTFFLLYSALEQFWYVERILYIRIEKTVNISWFSLLSIFVLPILLLYKRKRNHIE